MDKQVWALAERLWDYHRMNQELAPADAVLVLCSHDERVAERGAQLLLEGWAPLLIFSGGRGAITEKFWAEPEAERFARIAIGMQVPRDRILSNQTQPTQARTSVSPGNCSMNRESIRKVLSSCRSLTWNGEVTPRSARCGRKSRWW